MEQDTNSEKISITLPAGNENSENPLIPAEDPPGLFDQSPIHLPPSQDNVLADELNNMINGGGASDPLWIDDIQPVVADPQMNGLAELIRAKKPTRKKAEIREDIETLRRHLGYIYVEREGQLVKDPYATLEGKKDHFKRVLARMLDDAFQMSVGIQPQERLEVNLNTNAPPASLEAQHATHIRKREEYAAESLYRFNVAVAMMVEKVSMKFEDRTGMRVEGYHDNIKTSKDELIPIMRQIYVENQKVLEPYMSPTTALLMVNASAAMDGLKKISTGPPLVSLTNSTAPQNSSTSE